MQAILSAAVLRKGPEPRALGQTRRRSGRCARGMAAGAVVSIVVVLARVQGAVSGVGALTLLGFLALAVPTSRELSRRVLLAGCVIIGWFPLAWWIPMRVGAFGRGTLLLAALAGGLVGWLLAGEDPRLRARTLLPRTRLVDAWPVAFGVGTAAVLAPWLHVDNASSALAMLARGWDHSAHFGMTEMTRSHGVSVPGLGPGPSAEHWAYAHYPQGYHALAATVMELVSPEPGSSSTEIVLYAHAMGTIEVVGMVVLLAGLCALPSLRAKPLAALVLVTGVWSAVILGPGGGGRIILDGFPNFLIASLMLACLPLVLVPIGRVASPVHAAAAGGAVVAVAHGWVLLAVLAAPAVLVLLLPLRHSRWRGTPAAWSATIAVIVASVAASIEAIRLLGGQRLGDVLVVGGGITPPSLRITAVLAAAGLAATAVLAFRRRRLGPGRRSDVGLRTVAMGAVPVVGLAVAAAIAQLQLTTTGALGYYFWKYVLGLELLCVVLLALSFAALLASLGRIASRTSRVLQGAATAAICFALIQGWGAVSPALGWLRTTAAPGIAARAELSESADHPPMTAMRIWDPVALPRSTACRHVVYLSFPSDGRIHPIAAAQWLYALTGSWTDEANLTAGYLGPTDQSQERAIAVARNVLERDPIAVVVVGPALHGVIAGDVAADGWQERVVTW